MKRILYIINDGIRLKIGFSFAADAVAFLEEQSTNPSWRAMWSIWYLDNGNVSLETSHHVVLHFS